MTDQDLSDFSMLDLFRMEVETQTAILSENLLALETEQDAPEESSASSLPILESLMRAAHSVKGAARIVQVEPAVKVAHVMEDCFVAAQHGRITLSSDQIDILLQGVDLLVYIAQVPETDSHNWLAQQQAEVETLVAAISSILEQENPIVEASLENNRATAKTTLQQNLPVFEENSLGIDQLNGESSSQNKASSTSQPSPPPHHDFDRDGQGKTEKEFKTNKTDRGVRVSRENLNRLMGLAGESLVGVNWLQPFGESLQNLKRRQGELSRGLETLQELLAQLPSDRSYDVKNLSYQASLNSLRQQTNECYQFLSDRLSELELFTRRSANLSERLYQAAIATQMQPFADGVGGFPRMVRDLARQLGKQVKLEILGKSTQVDRDILEKLEAPITHLLRNAIDHGIESPEERLRAGKLAEGTVRLEAAHRSGMLLITISDDGRGVDLEQLRRQIVTKEMVSADMARQLTEAELMDFLFLPGFSTANSVTEISGRGVGLNIVQSMVQDVGGILRAVSQPNRGMSFYLQLPLTLSVIRALLVEISGEAYAFALTHIERVAMIPREEIFVSENREFFSIDGENIGLIAAHQVLELNESSVHSELDVLPVAIISDRSNHYGLVVDQFLGARDLVVRPLDSRLGKVQDISAAAIVEDGSIVLILDVEDLIGSIDKLLSDEKLSKIGQSSAIIPVKQPQRILVVDDSITVREVERKLLENKGYQVEVAVNGMDAWNAIRTGRYDLVVTDVDMPRMNGIELVCQIKAHPTLKSLPVIVVSYKDREEDYVKGLDVGANYYLTKSSFHDDTLIKAVIDLIGEA
jgi:two-component system, chemotaxis family, sensor histidine kinase and response regulator WspE